MTPTVFQSLSGMAELPWFAAHDDRVVVTDKGLGPIVDMHTHLALAYVLPMRVDLYRGTPRTEHYLPACCPFDLDVYANKNFTPEQVRELTRDLSLRSLTSRGMRATHTVPNLTREMGELCITRSVVLPIDFPVLSSNAEHALAAAHSTDALVAFGSVHPYAPDPERRLDAQLASGARGIKMHPAVQCVRPDDARAMRLYRACGERGMVVLWHCGPVGIEPRLGRWLSQVRFYERPIAENPRTTFVLGHAGALQMEQALELTRRYPNVYLETSSQSLGALRTLVERADPDRIVFGSDWPFYHQGVALAKVLIATEGRRDLRHKILWANAARLLNLED